MRRVGGGYLFDLLRPIAAHVDDDVRSVFAKGRGGLSLDIPVNCDVTHVVEKIAGCFAAVVNFYLVAPADKGPHNKGANKTGSTKDGDFHRFTFVFRDDFNKAVCGWQSFLFENYVEYLVIGVA